MAIDVEKYRKVRALAEQSPNAGERVAASSKLDILAKKAGLTRKAADRQASKVDSKPQSFDKPAANPFANFDDLMEEKEPGYKAEKAARMAESERARLARCKVLLEEFGSEAAVFAETKREAMLRTTLEPLADRRRYFNVPETYICGYAGWISGTPPAVLMAALERAYPFPRTIEEAWAELCQWRYLTEARIAFFPDHDSAVWVHAREAALELLMDMMPASNVDGFLVRLEWLEHLNQRGFSRDVKKAADLIAAMRRDFDVLVSSFQRTDEDRGCEVPQPRETTSSRRAAVMSILDTEPGLSDREIARRVGVSPQTVGNIRRRWKLARREDSREQATGEMQP